MDNKTKNTITTKKRTKNINVSVEKIKDEFTSFSSFKTFRGLFCQIYGRLDEFPLNLTIYTSPHAALCRSHDIKRFNKILLKCSLKENERNFPNDFPDI